MTDMLVKLYTLKVDWPRVDQHRQRGILYRQPLGSETHLILQWVEDHFSPGWVSEVRIALHQRPPRCILAVEAGKLRGFACYDAAALGLFGPMGVDPAVQGQGMGTLLLQLTLWQMKQQGYAYAVIGWVGPAEFYERTVGAIAIPDSEPGLWATRLQP